MLVSAEQLVALLKDGGQIVSSNDLSELAIAAAQACGRMHVDEDGFGYVYLPRPEWPCCRCICGHPSSEHGIYSNACAECDCGAYQRADRGRTPYEQKDWDTCQYEGCNEVRPDVPGPPDPQPYWCLKHRDQQPPPKEVA